MRHLLRTVVVAAAATLAYAGLWGCGSGTATPAAMNTPPAAVADELEGPEASAGLDTEGAPQDLLDGPGAPDGADAMGGRASQAPKGLQLILVSNWHPRSVDRLLAAFKDAHGRYTRGPSRIEISFAPYIYPAALPRYQNAQKIIDAFTASGKSVTANVFLTFHTPQRDSAADIERNARDFNNTFLRPNSANQRLTICVSPSLEDYGTDSEFRQWVDRVANQLDANLRGRVYLRRSGIRSQRISPDRRFRGVQSEYHGAVTTSGTHYSNDGNFVYYTAGNEDRNSVSSSGEPRYSLNDFLSRTAGNTNTVLLHRPAYNVARKYMKNGRAYFDFNGRDFLNRCDCFDGTEQAVVRQFLGIH